jgi:hypothetical protein
MPLDQAYLKDVETKLRPHSPALVDTFRESLDLLPEGATDEKLRLWADLGVELAGHALRSWEAAGEYYRAGAEQLPYLNEQALRQWVEAGSGLAELASPISAAFFRASPQVLPRLASSQVREWADLGHRLYKATWKSISLASELYDLSPALIDRLSILELGRLVRVLEGVSDRSADLAAACLDASPAVMQALDHAERVAFLDFAAAISDSAWPEASLYFQRGADLLQHIEPTQRAHYLEFATRVARHIGRQAFNLFADGALALRTVRHDYHGRTIDLADRLVNLSPTAAMSLVRIAPVLNERLRPEEIELWHQAGLQILIQTVEGGEAYFRLESGKAEQMIQSLSARVELGAVSELLRLYGKALTGANISVHPLAALTEKGIGWIHEGGATTEGTSIYLPEHIEEFDNKRDNFAVFKVYATHQTGHLEFGSFEFDFHQPGGVLDLSREEVERQRRSEGVVTKDSWLTDMERFFDLFTDRQLGSDVFSLVEDLRIDARIRGEYSGIRRISREVQAAELFRRPDPRMLPLREAFIENLVRASLDGAMTMVWPEPLEPLLFKAIGHLEQMREDGARVEDAAEATLLIYDLAISIPNLPAELVQNMDWENITEEMLRDMQLSQDVQPGLDELPEGEEAEYQSPGQVEFRGDFKPELVQLLQRMRDQNIDGEDEEQARLTPEQIKELLEKSVEVDVSDEFDMSDFNMMLENLQKEAEGPEVEPPEDEDQSILDQPLVELPIAARLYWYDEWDFRASDYKPRWCIVRERRMDEGGDDFYARTIREHAGLVNETQRQFELLKPETFRKIKRLEDGEDIDLDAAIEFMVLKRAGHGETQKIYWRRNKVERDVAVAFLLDMSASTDEEIDKHRPRRDLPADATDPRRYYGWLQQNRGTLHPDVPKRIIDLEKESLVLLTRALEVIGDRYGVYGFSGYGRENVEYYVIKDFEEPFGDPIRRRIDRMSPIRSTRMGPAIRHTVTKLMDTDARARILFLVSDGRPQDHGYGRDRTEKEYAIHDTHKALQEAKHKGITPFALTVDKEGHDYLGQMCGDMAYEVLGDIELLPSRLPTLYRMLTE